MSRGILRGIPLNLSSGNIIKLKLESPFIKEIYLQELRSPPVEEILDIYLNWLHDEEVTRYMTGDYKNYTRRDILEYLEKFDRCKGEAIFAIKDKGNGKYIGNITLQEVDLLRRQAAVGIMIGEREYWGRGYGTGAYVLLLDYAFRNKIETMISGGLVSNLAIMNLLGKLGFFETSRKQDVKGERAFFRLGQERFSEFLKREYGIDGSW